jgi:type III restriction enzyme
MISLKDYQTRVLGTLSDFFRECSRLGRPAEAFQAAQERQGRLPLPYLPVVAEGLAPEMPYVCLRVPTGGGKTLLACHAAGLAITDLLQAERAVVLWLVPSNTILDQTADALRNPRHPYRRALELACGAVEVVTIDEALRLTRGTVEGQTVVIVSTIQCFRVEDTTGRKVYAQNTAFAEHLQNVAAERLADLLQDADGKPVPSLVNMLRLRRPVVIVDEAHNARTELSFSTLSNIRPACIVEFTATPARRGNASNVLHHVSAAELKAADMIKLPIRVIVRHPSQRDQLLAEALTLRGDLERLAGSEAQGTGEYLRPILLLQAERVDACEPLRERLVSDFGIPKEQILISVGKLDELKDHADIAAPACPVRVILTVEKLREGWDCPFAYVLCSLKETRSATAIEQIVGRILRLPQARAKQQPDLNCAYVFSVSPSIADVLAELRDALVSNGFTSAESERIILPVQQGVLPLGVQPRTVALAPAEINLEATRAQVTSLGGKVRFDEARSEITVFVPLYAAECDRLSGCVISPEAKAKVIAAVELVRAAELAFGGNGAARLPTPYEQRLPFRVPRLSLQEGSVFQEFEATDLLEHPWKLSAKDAALPAGYSPLNRPTGTVGAIDVTVKGEVQAAQMQEGEAGDFIRTLHQQVFALGTKDDWTLERLVSWLDRHIDHQDIPVGESAEFLRRVLRGMLAREGISDIGVLALDRFRLRDAVERRIREHRAAEQRAAFKQFLLPGSKLTLRDEVAVDFTTMVYEPSWVYEGSFVFRNHYFGPKVGELHEKTPAGKLTEEFRCAQFLDHLPEVRFWVRNLSRKATSFRLQTSTDWFYPDFVCQLIDGRCLVVEYKGAHFVSGDDAEEKRAVGAVWAGRSGGRCRFVMPSAADFTEVAAAAKGG